MEQHPLLKELFNFCTIHNLKVQKAYSIFEIYLELAQVKKLSNLKYYFNERLQLFYLSGEKNETSEIYIPVMLNDEITPKKIDTIEENLCPNVKQFCIIVKDRDSSSTYYWIKKGLTMADCPKKRKIMEEKQYHFERYIQSCKKFVYSRALMNKESSEEDAPVRRTKENVAESE